MNAQIPLKWIILAGLFENPSVLAAPPGDAATDHRADQPKALAPEALVPSAAGKARLRVFSDKSVSQATRGGYVPKDVHYNHSNGVLTTKYAYSSGNPESSSRTNYHLRVVFPVEYEGGLTLVQNDDGRTTVKPIPPVPRKELGEFLTSLKKLEDMLAKGRRVYQTDRTALESQLLEAKEKKEKFFQSPAGSSLSPLKDVLTVTEHRGGDIDTSLKHTDSNLCFLASDWPSSNGVMDSLVEEKGPNNRGSNKLTWNLYRKYFKAFREALEAQSHAGALWTYTNDSTPTRITKFQLKFGDRVIDETSLSPDKKQSKEVFRGP